MRGGGGEGYLLTSNDLYETDTSSTFKKSQEEEKEQLELALKLPHPQYYQTRRHDEDRTSTSGINDVPIRLWICHPTASKSAKCKPSCT